MEESLRNSAVWFCGLAEQITRQHGIIADVINFEGFDRLFVRTILRPRCVFWLVLKLMRAKLLANSCCAGHLLRDPNWLLGGGFYRSRRWLGYHYRIGNRLRNV